MQFELTTDQAAVADAIAKIVEPYRMPPVNEHAYVSGEAVALELDRNGFFDLAQDAELGPLMAAFLIYEVAKLPQAVEIAASALVRPLMCPELPRPLAVITDCSRPTRFLPHARYALLVDPDGVRGIELSEGKIAENASLFAFPMGELPAGVLREAIETQIDRSELLRLWRIGIAAEIGGSIDGALRFTTEFVTQRQQFGRPIGSFQAVQHRLSEVAVASEAVRWLTLRAASSGRSEDALIACGHAQDVARIASRDLHQFNGAIGLTLEHPLHLWTYRIRALLSELGGAGAQDLALADSLWEAV